MSMSLSDSMTSLPAVGGESESDQLFCLSFNMRAHPLPLGVESLPAAGVALLQGGGEEKGATRKDPKGKSLYAHHRTDREL